MLNVKSNGIILQPTDLSFENKAVLNPACIKVGNITHELYIFYGAADRLIALKSIKLKELLEKLKNE
ncbi:hypothetical protein LLG07_00745 [bacterium]|nr:hypothetical protein [bacterium]